ncbi:MAG: 2OG-Fe dioxygenase family protein [Acidobacteriota bacterium]
MSLIDVKRNVCSEMQEKGYAWISCDEFIIALELEAERRSFWADWEQLEVDQYLKGGARFRERRYGCFHFQPSSGDISPLPPTPYYQTPEENAYAGGIQREFAPLLESTLENRFLHELIKFNHRQFPPSSRGTCDKWEIGVHQVRIVTTQDEEGEPTPEGIHHDGNDFFAVHLISRGKIAGGETTIYDNDQNPIESRTMLNVMDSLVVEDACVMHGVSPILLNGSSQRGIRDIIIIDYFMR